MSTIVNRNRTTKGSNVSTGRKKLALKNRKYGNQVTKLRAGQKVTASSIEERQGIYDTLRSLNLNTKFRTASNGNGQFVISKRYSKTK